MAEDRAESAEKSWEEFRKAQEDRARDWAESAPDRLRRMVEEAIQNLGAELGPSGITEAFASMTAAARYFGPRLGSSDLRTILRQEHAYSPRSYDPIMEPDPRRPDRFLRKKNEVPFCPDSWLILYHPSLLESLRDLRTSVLHPITGPDGATRIEHSLSLLRNLSDALALRAQKRPGRLALPIFERQLRYWAKREKPDSAAIALRRARNKGGRPLDNTWKRLLKIRKSLACATKRRTQLLDQQPPWLPARAAQVEKLITSETCSRADALDLVAWCHFQDRPRPDVEDLSTANCAVRNANRTRQRRTQPKRRATKLQTVERRIFPS